jgi:RecB family exonuclease
VDGLLALGTLLHADVSGLKVDGKLDVDALVKRLNVRELEPAVTHARRAEYSPSKLETYESCPRLYWFSQVLEIPGEEKPFFELGKTVHSVLQTIAERLRANQPVDETTALKILDGLWKASAYDTKAAEKKAREEAEDMVRKFLARQSTRPGKIIELETGIELDLEGRRLRGRVDRIDETKDGLEVIDYKTSKERTKTEDLKQDFQLALYKLGVEKRTGRKVKRVGLWYLRHDDPRMIELTAEEAEAVRRRALEVVKAIEAGKFEPAPDYQTCKYCDYKGLCGEAK